MVRPLVMPKGRRSGLVFRRGHGPSSVQPSLLPQSLDDVLPKDHLVRGLRSLVEELLGADLRSMCQLSGGIPHNPVGMLCVWLYAFMEGTATWRKLEELCRYDARYAHLSYATKPDHTTLSRFRDRLCGHMDAMLARVYRAAKEQGLVGSRAVALDGTKVSGRASQWNRAIQSSQDADARTMKGGDGKFVVGYNVQAAVLLDSGYVQASHVLADCNDMRAVAPMLDAMEAQSEPPSVVVADVGYDTAENHSQLLAHGVHPIIGSNPCRGRMFQPDEHGVLRCPAGHAPLKRTRLHQERVYDRYQVSRCSGCPIKAGCGIKGRQKSIEVPSGLSLKQAGLVVSNSPEDERLYRARGPSVELLFAILKQRTGFRRFRLGNLGGANHEIRLWTLSHNLRLLLEALFALLATLLRPHRQRAS